MKESKIAGRIAVHVPDHPKANNRGYVLRSRYVMEQALGRLLETDEEVHHRNEDPLDDHIENLEVKTKSQHAIDHGNLHPRERVLDYERIASLMASGLGYRKIAALTGDKLYSVRYVCRVLRKGAT